MLSSRWTFSRGASAALIHNIFHTHRYRFLLTHTVNQIHNVDISIKWERERERESALISNADHILALKYFPINRTFWQKKKGTKIIHYIKVHVTMQKQYTGYTDCTGERWPNFKWQSAKSNKLLVLCIVLTTMGVFFQW